MARPDHREKYWVHSAPEDEPQDPAKPPPPRRPAAQACEGPCNARWRKVQALLDAHQKAVEAWEAAPAGKPPAEPEVGEVRPWLGDPVFCSKCQARTRTELAELSDLAAIAEAENTGHRKGPDADRVSGSKYAPSPSPVCEDLDELAFVLRSWQAVALNEDETPARTGYLLSEIDTLTKRLSTVYFLRLMGNADVAGDFAREIRQWHKQLVGATKAGTGKHQKKEPCPRCGRYSLTWRDGDQYVACEGRDCGRLLSLPDYESHAEEWAARRSAAPEKASLARPDAA